MGVVLLARAHPPAKNAGKGGATSRGMLIRKDGPAPNGTVERRNTALVTVTSLL
jgi:hypothetical protein